MSNIKVIGKIGNFVTIKSNKNVSKYLQAYVEDCSQSESISSNYKYDHLINLKYIGLDLSTKCVDSINNTLIMLKYYKYGGDLFIHFDQTKDSTMCGDKTPDTPDGDPQTIYTECFKRLLLNITTKKILDGVLWEQESNKFINNCASKNCKNGINKINSLYKGSFKSNPIKFSGWTTNFKFIDKRVDIENWDYILYEYYNIYTKCWTEDQITEKQIKNNKKLDNTKCYIDYSKKDFEGAVLYAEINDNNNMIQNTKKICNSKPDCTSAKNTVYCLNNNNITPFKRGQWVAYIYVSKGGIKDVEDIEKKIIFFPFTNGSKPTFLDILDTYQKFDEFIEGFIKVFKTANCLNIDKCIFGAWGCPKWIAKSDTKDLCV